MHFNSFIPFIGRKPAVVSGCLVVESDPVIQYDDNSQLSRLPEHQINWSKLVTDTNQLARWSDGAFSLSPGKTGYFGLFLNVLKRRRFDVINVAFLPRCQLYPGMLNGISVTVQGHYYSLYRFDTPSNAMAFGEQHHHTLINGTLVIRSLPEKMHKFPRHEIGHEQEDKIEWPELLESRRLHKALDEFLACQEALTPDIPVP